MRVTGVIGPVVAIGHFEELGIPYRNRIDRTHVDLEIVVFAERQQPVERQIAKWAAKRPKEIDRMVHMRLPRRGTDEFGRPV